MPHLKVGSNEIFYQVSGSGFPIVLISGFMSDHLAWMMVKGKLKGYQVITLDNRGVGRTVWDEKDFSVDSIADDIIALTNHLKLEKYDVVGVSFGGAIAQALVRKDTKVRKLVLSNTFSKFSKKSLAVLEEGLEIFNDKKNFFLVFNFLSPHFFSKKFFSKKVIAANVFEMIRSLTDSPKPSGYKAQLKAIKDLDFSKGEKVNIPTLIIHSDEDLLVSYDEVKPLLKQFSLLQVKVLKGGHGIILEQTGNWTKTALEFLENDWEDCKPDSV